MLEGTKIAVDLSGLERLGPAIHAGAGTPEIDVMLKQWRMIYLSFVQVRAIGASRGDGTWKPLAPSTVNRRRPPAKHNRKPKSARAKKAHAKRYRKAKRRAERKAQSDANKRMRRRPLTVKKLIRKINNADNIIKKAATKQGKRAIRTAKGAPRKVRKLSASIRKTVRGAIKKHKANKKASAAYTKRARKVAILKDKGILFNVLNPTVENAPGSVAVKKGLSVLVGYGGSGTHSDQGAITIAGIAEAHQLGNKKRNLPARKIIVNPNEKTMKLMENAAQRQINKLLKRIEAETKSAGPKII